MCQAWQERPWSLGDMVTGSGEMVLAIAQLTLELLKLTGSALRDSQQTLWAWSEQTPTSGWGEQRKSEHLDDGGDNDRPGRSQVKREPRIIRTIIIIRSVTFQSGTVPQSRNQRWASHFRDCWSSWDLLCFGWAGVIWLSGTHLYPHLTLKPKHMRTHLYTSQPCSLHTTHSWIQAYTQT